MWDRNLVGCVPYTFHPFKYKCDRFSTGTQKRVESINAVVFFRGVVITKKATRSLAGIAGIVAVAALISKVFGLVRRVR